MIRLLACGALLALATIFGLEFLDRRVRIADDIAAMINVPVIGVLPAKNSQGSRRLSFSLGNGALLGGPGKSAT